MQTFRKKRFTFTKAIYEVIADEERDVDSDSEVFEQDESLLIKKRRKELEISFSLIKKNSIRRVIWLTIPMLKSRSGYKSKRILKVQYELNQGLINTLPTKIIPRRALRTFMLRL